MKHEPYIVEAWGDLYKPLKKKIREDGDIKEKPFIKFMGTWLVDGFNFTNVHGKGFFYPQILIQLRPK